MENGDDWLARDKLYHVLFCFSISIFTSLLASRTRYLFLRRRSIFLGSIVSLAAGTAKEVADEFGFFKSAGASSKDAAADLLGVLIAAFVLSLSKSIFSRRRSDRSDEIRALEMVSIDDSRPILIRFPFLDFSKQPNIVSDFEYFII
ncbi:hypothetical protein LguiA_028495 [Lonicera macranthoides]